MQGREGILPALWTPDGGEEVKAIARSREGGFAAQMYAAAPSAGAAHLS